MESERTSITIAGETLTKLRAAANIVDRKPHDVALAFIRDCLAAVESSHRPTSDDLPTVELIRRVSRRNLSGGDRLIIGWLEKRFPSWRDTTAEYRKLLVKLTRDAEDLDVEAIQRAADEAWATVQASRKKAGKSEKNPDNEKA